MVKRPSLATSPRSRRVTGSPKVCFEMARLDPSATTEPARDEGQLGPALAEDEPVSSPGDRLEERCTPRVGTQRGHERCTDMETGHTRSGNRLELGHPSVPSWIARRSSSPRRAAMSASLSSVLGFGVAIEEIGWASARRNVTK